MKAYALIKACTGIFTTTLGSIAKNWKQPKCPSTGKWINSVAYPYNKANRKKQRKKEREKKKGRMRERETEGETKGGKEGEREELRGTEEKERIEMNY